MESEGSFYRIHTFPPPVSILSQIDPVHAPTPHFQNIRFNISNTEFFISPLYCLGRTKGSAQVRGTSLCFITGYIFTVRSC